MRSGSIRGGVIVIAADAAGAPGGTVVFVAGAMAGTALSDPGGRWGRNFRFGGNVDSRGGVALGGPVG